LWHHNSAPFQPNFVIQSLEKSSIIWAKNGPKRKSVCVSLGFIPQHFNSFFATLASKLHQNVVLFLFCGRLDLWYETNDCMLVWGGIFVLNYNLQLWYCRPLELGLLHTFQDAMQGYYPHLTFLGFKCFRIVLVWPRGCWTAGRKASWVLNG
jgi:hypothetical protein